MTGFGARPVREDDVARMVEESHAAVDAWAKKMGLVLIELVAGEEPEEGVEVEVVAVPPDDDCGPDFSVIQ